MYVRVNVSQYTDQVQVIVYGELRLFWIFLCLFQISAAFNLFSFPQNRQPYNAFFSLNFVRETSDFQACKIYIFSSLTMANPYLFIPQRRFINLLLVFIYNLFVSILFQSVSICFTIFEPKLDSLLRRLCGFVYPLLMMLQKDLDSSQSYRHYCMPCESFHGLAPSYINMLLVEIKFFLQFAW